MIIDKSWGVLCLFLRRRYSKLNTQMACFVVSAKEQLELSYVMG